MGSICHAYMCIVLYMKLIWCNGFAEIYAQLEGVNCHRYMYIILYINRSVMGCATFSVAVLKGSMLDLGVLICHGYMCIVLYMKLIWCNGFVEIYDLLLGVNCHGYMCIVLYMKLIWCNGFAEIYAQLEGVNCNRYMYIILIYI